MRLLLDTNVLIAYIRDHKTRDKIDQQFAPFHNSIPLLSVVSLGEIQSLILRNNWGDRKIAAILALVNKCLVLNINTREVIKQYSEIENFSQGKHPFLPLHQSARNMGKNDLWIAATASSVNATLLTTDKDFVHLHNVFLPVEQIALLN